MLKKELPIFFDQNKRRWKTVKIALTLLGFAGVCFLVFVTPSVLSIQPVPSLSAGDGSKPVGAGSESAESIAKSLNSMNAPVVGAGPLVRVLRVENKNEHHVGLDPFTNVTLRTFNEQDMLEIGDRPYAIDRYGQVGQKQIALTFDDGPDPKYTPQLLDLLSKHSAPSTFFVVGEQMVQHPDIAQRITREGHTLGNHTFTHANLESVSRFSAMQEINQSERVIRATTNKSTSFFRPPYIDATNQGLRNDALSILRAQHLGYTITAYDYDTHDWKFTGNEQPDFSKLDPQTGHVVLLHDSGGDRSHTLKFVEQMLVQGEKEGYKFVTIDQMYPDPALYNEVYPSFSDQVSFSAGRVVMAWPQQAATFLFLLGIVLMVATTTINITLAALNHRRSAKKRWPKYEPRVSVVIAAYNEERVLAKTLNSLLSSDYKKLEIVVVNDGSEDKTGKIADGFAAKYDRVTAIHQQNDGKSVALNLGINHTKSKIVVCADADTIFAPQAIKKLVRHFKDPQVGGVAGTVKAGNAISALVRWQMLDYLVGIHVERSAQAYLGAVMIVPGACCAWRRKALIEAGGYSEATLAEDCDLTLSVRKAGYKIAQDNDAIAYTECPMLLVDLAKQRFRWVFGNVQSMWKHRAMFFDLRYGWLGITVMPNAALGIAIAFLFWPFLTVLTIHNLILGNYLILIAYLGITMSVHFVMAFAALLFAKESLRLLFVVPMTRLVYAPLRTYLIYKVFLTAVKGVYVGWNKLTRSGTIAELNKSKTN